MKSNIITSKRLKNLVSIKDHKHRKYLDDLIDVNVDEYVDLTKTTKKREVIRKELIDVRSDIEIAISAIEDLHETGMIDELVAHFKIEELKKDLRFIDFKMSCDGHHARFEYIEEYRRTS